VNRLDLVVGFNFLDGAVDQGFLLLPDMRDVGGSLPSSHGLFVNLTHAGDPVAVPLTGSGRCARLAAEVDGRYGRSVESHWTERSTANHSSTPATSPPRYPNRYVPGAAGRSVSRWMWEPHWSGCISTDETSSVTRSRRRAHRRSQYKCAGCRTAGRGSSWVSSLATSYSGS
jgi:hypothetical protein